MKNMGATEFSKINVEQEDLFIKLWQAYDMVIEDCSDWPLLVDLLSHKKSLNREYSNKLMQVAIFIRLTGFSKPIKNYVNYKKLRFL